MVSNGILYFSADNDTSGKELWKTDGTVTGTMMIADINTGLGHSYPDGMVDINGKLFFAANNGVSGRELWAMNLGTGIVSPVHNSSVTISVYPNPFSERVMVPITNVYEFANNQFLFAIYNIMGEVVSQSEIRNSQSEISFSDLPSGIYFYKIKNDNSIFSGKLIIQ